MLTREDIIGHIIEKKIIAIVRRLPGEQLVALGSALIAGGIDMIEVTFDQANPGDWANTCAGIRALGDEFKGQIVVGAGTVLTETQLQMAHDAGARYIISPDANPAIIAKTRALGLVSLPGCMTPTEITAAVHAGADFVKLFPAGTLGTDYIRAVRAPLSHVRMLAVGGVNEKNARQFLDAGCLGIGVGGNLVDKNKIASGRLDEITALARAYVEAVG